ncbi:P-II family nitrogen regulator [Desulfosarcina ovata]|uniref:P-II family nitrogen regulator n=2 Tax=Desulfosarcina ovata TaxID=83564 RepID=A0A5K8AHU1_9BACT|nr:P-II family nitrogen regulator [Desulfosarcina ovata]BBO85351.1 P-II family nitrogen regulator [Desulfosarcina ovata subsp. sediminis]BBO92255.1 P-II family nitrogen regulator [Desulfosarcina ovata subsp. ovata]
MKEIMAIVRMNMINQTRKALTEVGVSSMTANDALGRGAGLVDMSLLKGAEQGYEEAISQLGQSNRLIPKRMIIIVSKDKHVDKIVKTIIKVNQTGKPGDGKIFVLPVADSISVRTAEDGDSTLDDL